MRLRDDVALDDRLGVEVQDRGGEDEALDLREPLELLSGAVEGGLPVARRRVGVGTDVPRVLKGEVRDVDQLLVGLVRVYVLADAGGVEEAEDVNIPQ